ncbi:MAG: putative F420-dependent oxidoreductase [Gammaproteobacteria bacterium]|jgi:probable F420-dependent oxidoreductase
MKIGVSLPVRELQDDIGAIKAFAVLADELGFTHLRVPDQVLRPNSGHLHEPMTLLSYLAGVTNNIELVPSVIVLPLRQTALLAKQAVELDQLSNGRLRLGVGVGASEVEFRFLGQDFRTRGRRCDEQLQLLHLLWTQENVEFDGTWDQISGAGLNPLPVQRPIPVWIGAQSNPVDSVIQRIGRQANGWFVLCSPEEFAGIDGKIRSAAETFGRDPNLIGTEAGVAVVGPRESEWQDRVRGWQKMGLTYVCLRTLGGKLNAEQHLSKLQAIVDEIPGGL